VQTRKELVQTRKELVQTRFKLIPCLLAGVLAAVASGLHSQQPAPPASSPSAPHPAPVPRSIVLVDAAHGGTDPGADLGDKVAEKTITLALATKLRGALAAQGFAVVLTRDSDTVLTAQQRSEIANRSHPIACLSLHSTRSASGVHVYTSALQPGTANPEAASEPRRWETLQQDSIGQSQHLAAVLKKSFADAGLPAEVSSATVPPLDSLMCPAVAVEFAPVERLASGDKGASDSGYQDSVVRAMAAGVAKWRADTAPQTSPAAPDVKAAP
jgi:N-acetylmuramoyl-L-alanine amidase